MKLTRDNYPDCLPDEWRAKGNRGTNGGKCFYGWAGDLVVRVMSHKMPRACGVGGRNAYHTLHVRSRSANILFMKREPIVQEL